MVENVNSVWAMGSSFCCVHSDVEEDLPGSMARAHGKFLPGRQALPRGNHGWHHLHGASLSGRKGSALLSNNGEGSTQALQGP